jgi:hypothetical protein
VRKHGRVESQTNAVLTLRTPEDLAIHPNVLLTRNFPMAVRTRCNIPKSTIRTHRGQDRTGDIATILACRPESLVLLRNLRVRRVTVLLQYPLNFVPMIGRELEVRLALTITVRAVQRVVAVKLQAGVCKQVAPYCGSPTQVFGRVIGPPDRDT